MEWTIEPGAVAWILTAETLWLRAARTLRRRGRTLPAKQWCFWHGGMALWVAGLLSPIHALGEESLGFHMAQHLLIADLAAPLLVLGLRTPMLQHFLPRSVLVPLARSRLRRVFRTLRKPVVAIAAYVVVLYGWHMGPLFSLAVEHDLAHALQHASFVGAGVLVWWSALEPKRARTPGALWKIGHIVGARMAGMFLGMSFVLIRYPVYTGVYGTDDRALGLTALQDQAMAGGMMVVLDILIMLFALSYFFMRAGQEHDREEAARAARRAAAAA